MSPSSAIGRRRRSSSYVIPLASAAGSLLAEGARRSYASLPGFSERGLVNKVIRAAHELKNFDSGVLVNTVSTTAYTSFLLNGVLQGVTGNTRTGRKIKQERISIRLSFSNVATLANGDDLRVIVITDKECRGSAAGTSDILQDNTYGLSALMSHYKFDNVPTRLTILADRLVSLPPTVSTSATNAAWNQPLHFCNMEIPLNNIVHFYNTSGGGIADIDSNSLYIFMFGHSSVATNYNLDYRLTFRDL